MNRFLHFYYVLFIKSGGLVIRIKWGKLCKVLDEIGICFFTYIPLLFNFILTFSVVSVFLV